MKQVKGADMITHKRLLNIALLNIVFPSISIMYYD